MNKIVIYTDGSSRGNPGPGGFGAIIISNLKSLPRRQAGQISKVKEIGGREEMTTNNRMEIRAVIEALRNTEVGSEVEIHSDSEYVIKGITEWIHNWQKNNWRTKNKKPVLNQDLWQELLIEMKKRKIKWKKVLGHSGHSYNDRCDEIATSFADGKNLKLYAGLAGEYKI